MSKLKPCPRCGDYRCPNVAEVQRTFSWTVTLFCRNPRCHHSAIGRGVTRKIAVKNAEKAWNKTSPVVSIPSIDAPWS